MKKLRKSALFGDIHFGRKANSELHNQDCCNFIDWFCNRVKEDPEIDNILFLGDWNENRSALNIATMNFSYKAAKKLNELGLPIYFVVGNHDLYHRHTREIHSVIPFNEFANFVLIESPTVLKNIGPDGILMCPYLFHDEYPDLGKYLSVPFWAGHFEFRGFDVTGNGMKMPTGPVHTAFKGPKIIASGHFHKRQAHDNVVYIGNTFPMDFGDAGDNERGYTTYDHIKEEMLFYDWEDCPKYTKTSLTALLEDTSVLHHNSRVKCLVDIPVSFEESTYLRKKFINDFDLRELVLEEAPEIREAVSDTECSVDWEKTKLASVDEMVQIMLKDIDSKHINNQTLINIYNVL